jgi:uncharacterized membrane protein
MKPYLLKKQSDILFTGILLAASLILVFAPTGFEDAKAYRAKLYTGTVVSADDTFVRQFGIVKTGDQKLDVKMESGPFRGKIIAATNHLSGKMEIDSIFREGNSVLVNVDLNADGSIASADVRDHQRIPAELILAFIFAALLVGFAGWTGFKALMSFLFTALAIWKFLIPMFLKGYDPVIVSLFVTASLCAAVIFLVSGFSGKGLTAFGGTLCGIVTTAVIAGLFAEPFKINGAVRPFSEMLLYSGFASLSLNKMFLAGVFISSSGALMDLAMDISASQHEVYSRNPGISRMELMKAGFSVGKVVVGTMTTTLLLAYSGGYTALLMIFMSKGGSLQSFFNSHYVANELFYTMAGSVGLVATAPLTAIAGSFILCGKRKNDELTVAGENRESAV